MRVQSEDRATKELRTLEVQFNEASDGLPKECHELDDAPENLSRWSKRWTWLEELLMRWADVFTARCAKKQR